MTDSIYSTWATGIQTLLDGHPCFVINELIKEALQEIGHRTQQDYRMWRCREMQMGLWNDSKPGINVRCLLLSTFSALSWIRVLYI